MSLKSLFPWYVWFSILLQVSLNLFFHHYLQLSYLISTWWSSTLGFQFFYMFLYTTRNLAFCNCLMQLVFNCMRHATGNLPSCLRQVACDSRIIQVHTVGLYDFIHPYSILAVGRATACNYRGCIHTALHVN